MLRWLSWPYWKEDPQPLSGLPVLPEWQTTLFGQRQGSQSATSLHILQHFQHTSSTAQVTAINLEPQSWPDGCLLFVAPKQSSAAGCFQQLSEELSNSCWGSPHANKSLDELILPQLQPSVVLSSPPSDNPQAWWFGDSLLYFVASSSSQVNVRAVARDRRNKTRWETEHSSQHRSRWKTKTVGGFQLAQRSTCVPLHLVRCWVPLCPWLAFTVNK